MSDLSITLEALERSAAQLPVSSYFDEAVYRREEELIIRPGPRYLGHALAVPEVGDHHALLQEGEGRALLRTADGIELISNVCRHRQAVMLRGRGNAGSHIVCPLHRWTYDLHGRLVGAPHFPDDPCLHLNNYPVQQWNGLLFEGGPRRCDIAELMLERALSAPFVRHDRYGTRCSTVALVENGGRTVVHERRFDPTGAQSGGSRIEVAVPA